MALFCGEIKDEELGVPFVAQQLMNPTSIHEGVGLILGLAQWVGDLAFAVAVV